MALMACWGNVWEKLKTGLRVRGPSRRESRLCSRDAAGTQAGRPRRLARALADLLFPPRCLACERPLETGAPPSLCPDCLGRARRLGPPLCFRCGAPVPAAATAHPCPDCLREPPPFALARSPLRYEGPVRDGLIALKFHGDFTWLATLAALCRESALMDDFREPDRIVPAPLHIERLRTRGFNQALELARACFPQWRDRIRPDALLRRRATPPQTGLDGAARRLNPVGAFVAAPGADLAGRRVLLVDDVFTTGATLGACARALLDAGASRVEAFTAARSVKRLEGGPPFTPGSRSAGF